MTSKTALFALLAMWGVGLGSGMPARAEEAALDDAVKVASETGASEPEFTNRVWIKSDSPDQPGVIRIFLSDGTLVQDSCWETHRLSPWTMSNDTELKWNEDGVEIKARIADLTADHLTLVLDLKGGPVTEHYAAAPVPSVCPDMPKA